MVIKSIFSTSLGRLRLIGFLEGFSLLFLLFVAVPLKYGFDFPQPVKITGSIHGALFLLFVLNTFQTSVEMKWEFGKITWRILIACLIPFGTFYIDKKILKTEYRKQIVTKN